MAATRVSISFPPSLTLPKLDGTNWAAWSTAFDALMRLNGLRRHVTHSTPVATILLAADAPAGTPNTIDPAHQATFDQEEEALIGLLILNLTTEVWKQVASMMVYPTICEKIEELNNLYGSMGAMATFNLWVALVNTKLQEGQPFRPQFQKIMETRNTLAENGMSISEMQMCCILLDALPTSFSAVAGTILAATPLPSMEARSIVDRVVNEESRLSGSASLTKIAPVKGKGKGRQPNPASSSSSAPQGDVTCFYCKKVGHKANSVTRRRRTWRMPRKAKRGRSVGTKEVQLQL